MYSYKTTGTCSRRIELDIQNNIIQKVMFQGGCDGNLKGISNLVIGMSPKDAEARLKGINCGNRGTSCPDQLSKALADWIRQNP